MPVYDYVCGACGHVLEVIHGIHAEGPRFCPSCGAEGRMTKGFNAPSVVFKGSGWAKKDRRATSSPAKSSTESKPATADSGSSSSGGSESSSSSSSSKSSSKASTSSSAGGD
ncbi:MAG TPA: FmdB family zinc ribbon protein [Candidatus Polarisedimenticolia bacterium]|nr:FmdB family zinc ribbon protein [Candidatus Polarisedimenticolia bacterium]